MKDAFGVERGVSKAITDPVPRKGQEGATYDKAKAENWAKQGYKVVARDNANGRSYSRSAVHPNVPAKTRKPRYGAGLGERIKTRLVGRSTYKPDYTKIQYQQGSGKIDEGKVYQSRAVYRAKKRESLAKGLPSALRGKSAEALEGTVGRHMQRVSDRAMRRGVDLPKSKIIRQGMNAAYRSNKSNAYAASRVLRNTLGRENALRGNAQTLRAWEKSKGFK